MYVLTPGPPSREADYPPAIRGPVFHLGTVLAGEEGVRYVKKITMGGGGLRLIEGTGICTRRPPWNGLMDEEGMSKKYNGGAEGRPGGAPHFVFHSANPT